MRYAIVLLLCSTAQADIMVAKLGNYSYLVVEYNANGLIRADAQIDQNHNFGICGYDERPFGFVDPANDQYSVTMSAADGGIFPCSSGVEYYQTETVTFENEGRVHFDVTPGDANLDGIFASDDLVYVMRFGQYEAQGLTENQWPTGDWNLDRRFDSGDLVTAFEAGGYESGAVAVPEPSCLVLCLCAFMLRIVAHRRPRSRCPRD